MEIRELHSQKTAGENTMCKYINVCSAREARQGETSTLESPALGWLLCIELLECM